jgi:hypothetical protein
VTLHVYVELSRLGRLPEVRGRACAKAASASYASRF